MFLDGDHKGENETVEPLQPEECHRKPEAGTADGATGFERTRRNQSVDLLTHRLERMSDHRDELLLQCAQSRRRRGLIPTVRSRRRRERHTARRKGIQRGGERAEVGTRWDKVFAASVNGLVVENPGVTGLAEVEVEWLNQFRKQLISASHVEHSRDPPERGTSANSDEIADPNARPCSSRGCTEHQQAGIHSPQSPPPSKGPAPPTNNERKIQSQLEHRR